MTITTSRGKTFPVDWAYVGFGPAGALTLHLHDGRPLLAIAADFDGCDCLRRESDEEGDMTFEGYTVLAGILRPALGTDPTAVQITLFDKGRP